MTNERMSKLLQEYEKIFFPLKDKHGKYKTAFVDELIARCCRLEDKIAEFENPTVKTCDNCVDIKLRTTEKPCNTCNAYSNWRSK